MLPINRQKGLRSTRLGMPHPSVRRAQPRAAVIARRIADELSDEIGNLDAPELLLLSRFLSLGLADVQLRVSIVDPPYWHWKCSVCKRARTRR